MPYVGVIGDLSCLLFIFVTNNTAGRRRQERESLFSIGQTLRIKKGPLKGYLCRVVRMYRNDITVKLDSLVKLLTGLLGICCFILALFCLFSCKWLSLIMFELDTLIIASCWWFCCLWLTSLHLNLEIAVNAWFSPPIHLTGQVRSCWVLLFAIVIY